MHNVGNCIELKLVPIKLIAVPEKAFKTVFFFETSLEKYRDPEMSL